MKFTYLRGRKQGEVHLEKYHHTCSLIPKMDYYSLAILIVILSEKTYATPCEVPHSVELLSPDVLDNGTVVDKIQGISYPPQTYFKVDGENGDIYRGCPCKIESRPCLRKCCPIGMALNGGKHCEAYEGNFQMNVTVNDREIPVDGEKHFALIIGSYCRSNQSYFLDPKQYFEDTFFIRSSDGILTTPLHSDEEYGVDDFCLEYFVRDEENKVIMCSPEDFLDQTESRKITSIVYPIFMMISIPPLLVTFLVYALIPELRNLHGKCLICYVFCLMCTYLFLSVVQLGGSDLYYPICISTAFLVQFTFLGAFFWLNVMCIDICLTYCFMKGRPDSVHEDRNKRFIIYSAYAWGCTSVIIIISLIMDLSPGVPEHYIKPRFGRSRCWFDRKIEALTYFYAPVSILITFNIIMYIITAVKVVRLKKMVQRLEEPRNRNRLEKDNHNRFKLYLKLLFIMGITWIMEVIAWAVEGPDYFWYLTDIANCLQGVFIFIIFVWQKRIRKIVIRKICPNVAERQSTCPSLFKKCFMVCDWNPSKASVTGDTSSSSTLCHLKENIRIKPIVASGAKSDDADDDLVA